MKLEVFQLQFSTVIARKYECSIQFFSLHFILFSFNSFLHHLLNVSEWDIAIIEILKGTLLKELIFARTNFRESSSLKYFAGRNFREFAQKFANSRKLLLAKITSLKVQPNVLIKPHSMQQFKASVMCKTHIHFLVCQFGTLAGF